MNKQRKYMTKNKLEILRRCLNFGVVSTNEFSFEPTQRQLYKMADQLEKEGYIEGKSIDRHKVYRLRNYKNTKRDYIARMTLGTHKNYLKYWDEVGKKCFKMDHSTRINRNGVEVTRVTKNHYALRMKRLGETCYFMEKAGVKTAFKEKSLPTEAIEIFPSFYSFTEERAWKREKEKSNSRRMGVLMAEKDRGIAIFHTGKTQMIKRELYGDKQELAIKILNAIPENSGKISEVATDSIFLYEGNEVIAKMINPVKINKHKESFTEGGRRKSLFNVDTINFDRIYVVPYSPDGIKDLQRIISSKNPKTIYDGENLINVAMYPDIKRLSRFIDVAKGTPEIKYTIMYKQPWVELLDVPENIIRRKIDG